jgi:hypothetical protein
MVVRAVVKPQSPCFSAQLQEMKSHSCHPSTSAIEACIHAFHHVSDNADFLLESKTERTWTTWHAGRTSYRPHPAMAPSPTISSWRTLASRAHAASESLPSKAHAFARSSPLYERVVSASRSSRKERSLTDADTRLQPRHVVLQRRFRGIFILAPRHHSRRGFHLTMNSTKIHAHALAVVGTGSDEHGAAFQR